MLDKSKNVAELMIQYLKGFYNLSLFFHFQLGILYSYFTYQIFVGVCLIWGFAAITAVLAVVAPRVVQFPSHVALISQYSLILANVSLVLVQK